MRDLAIGHPGRWRDGAPVLVMMSSAAVLAAPVTTIGGGSNYAVGWFTLSLINAGLAQTKNRSALAWWAISLLLGPLATLVIVSPVRAR